MIQHASDAPVYTTGQVARRFGISIQTVIRCVDSGTLKGFRVPGSSHRRITAASVDEFSRRFDLPEPEISQPVRVHLDDAGRASTVKGVQCCVWTGRTSTGIPVRFHVAHIEFDSQVHQKRFEQELQAVRVEEPAEELPCS